MDGEHSNPGGWLARFGAWLRRARIPERRRPESEQGSSHHEERALPPEIDPVALAAWKAKYPGMLRPVWIEDLGTGAYDMHCMHCRHVFRQTGLLHGFGENSFLTLGYVCTRCHQLTEITWNRTNPRQEHPICACGGALARDGLMRCPSCGSPDLTCGYLPSIVT